MRKKVKKRYAANCTRHASKRAEQRYGLEIGKRGLQKIVKAIRSGDCRPCPGKRQTGTRRVLIVNYDGRELVVVYSKKINSIVSVLPMKEMGT